MLAQPPVVVDLLLAVVRPIVGWRDGLRRLVGFRILHEPLAKVHVAFHVPLYLPTQNDPLLVAGVLRPTRDPALDSAD